MNLGYIGWDMVAGRRKEEQRGRASQEKRSPRTEGAANVRNAAQNRLVVWREASPILNDIYVHYMYIGRFKEITPRDLINYKRSVDRSMYSNEALFSPNYMGAYLDFMKAAFATYQGWLCDPALRTAGIRPHDVDDPSVAFTNEDCRRDIHKGYWALQRLAQDELNVYDVLDPGQQPPPLPKGTPAPAGELLRRKAACGQDLLHLQGCSPACKIYGYTARLTLISRNLDRVS
jgi:hypothetical protein